MNDSAPQSESENLVIAGHTIAPGEIRDLELKFSESYFGSPVAVPARVLRAPEDGPKVFLAGAIHGDELTGVGIIRDLLYDEPPDLVCGTLICIPVANTYGLEHLSRYLPDRRDLNRCFPGSATGSLTTRLAYELFNEVVSRCDYGIDFHSAAVRRTNYPNVRADTSDPRVKELATAFGCELIVSGKGPEGSLRRTACKHGVPTIILEGGEVWKNEPNVVQIGVRGVMNVLKHLGMMKGRPEPPLFQVTVSKTAWVRAERGGFLGFHSKPGDVVAEGQVLATNYSLFGRERNVLVSPTHGIVLGMTTMPAVKPGEPVYHIARLAKRTYNRIRRRIEESSDEHLFNRIQSDLSTNIIIQERTYGNSEE